MKLLPLLIVLLLSSSTAFAQGRPPQKPIEISCEVGEVAGVSDKVSVDLQILVKPEGTASKVLVRDAGMSGGRLELELDDLLKISDALEDASESLLDGLNYTKKIRQITVKIGSYGDDKTVEISAEQKGLLIFGSSAINLDSDNAAGLARVLKRSKKNADWLLPRSETFQKKQSDK